MICGHLERGGDRGTEICTANPGHTGQHLMEVFSLWSREITRWYRERGDTVPEWLTELAEDVLRFGVTELRDALEADRVIRGTLGSQPGDGQVPGSRSTRPGWQDAERSGAEWRAPDNGDRSVAPQSAGKVPPDVQIVHAGSIGPRTRGTLGMATADELVAAIDAQIATIREWQQAVAQLRETIEQSRRGVLALSPNATHNVAAAAVAEAEERVGRAIQDGEVAIELLSSWSTKISAAIEGTG